MEKPTGAAPKTLWMKWGGKRVGQTISVPKSQTNFILSDGKMVEGSKVDKREITIRPGEIDDFILCLMLMRQKRDEQKALSRELAKKAAEDYPIAEQVAKKPLKLKVSKEPGAEQVAKNGTSKA